MVQCSRHEQTGTSSHQRSRSPDAVNHQPEFTAACVSPSADRAVRDGALALALTALAAATDDEQRDRLIGGVSRRREVPATAAGGAA